MAQNSLTLIDDGQVHTVDARVEAGSLWISPSALEASLGWKLESKGLCRGDTCIPTEGHAGLTSADGIEIGALAALLGRPLAADPDECVASLGASAKEHGAALSSGAAPAFELPDLSGTLHSLSDFRGKKVLLIAYASW